MSGTLSPHAQPELHDVLPIVEGTVQLPRFESALLPRDLVAIAGCAEEIAPRPQRPTRAAPRTWHEHVAALLRVKHSEPLAAALLFVFLVGLTTLAVAVTIPVLFL